MNDSISGNLKEKANLISRLDRMPLTRTNLIISFLLLSVWLCEAFDMGVVSAVLVFVKDLWNLTPTDQSLLGTSATMGVAIGALVAGRLMDVYGRKKIMILGVAIFSIFTIACAAFPDKYWIIVSRFIAGLAIGAVYPIPYLIISEVVGSKKRGTVIGVCMGIMIIWYAVPSIVGKIILNTFPLEVAWRIPFMIGGIPLIMVFFLIKFVPESPRWLLDKGRVKEVKDLVEKLEDEAGLEHDDNLVDPGILKSLEDAGDDVKSGFRAIIKPPYRSRLYIGFLSAAGATVTAYALMVFAPMIFTEVIGADKAFQFTAIMLISGFFGAIFVERVAVALGRKITFAIYSLLAICGFILVAHHTSPSMLLIAGVVGSVFGTGVTPFIKTYWAEQFPTHLRGLGAGIMESSVRAFGGIFGAALIPFIFASYGIKGVFYFVTACYLLALIPFSIWGRETAGLSMEEASGVGTATKKKAAA